MDLGAWGEKRAARYLRDNGVAVLARNYRCRIGEIDIVAREADTVVFVEVKTRSRLGPCLPCEAVGGRKRRRITRAALRYIAENAGAPGAGGVAADNFRFDVIEVLALDGKTWLRHIRGAF